MDLTARVVRRFLAHAENRSLQERIEQIPGYQRSNFLVSLLTQVRRGANLSAKQLAILDKIEAEQGSRGGGGGGPAKPPSDAIPWASRGAPSSKDFDTLYKALQDGIAKVYDPSGHFAEKSKLIGDGAVDYFVAAFDGLAEEASERNADEDDPRRRAVNDDKLKRAREASNAMYHAHVEVKRDGSLVTVTIRPSYMDLSHRFRL